MAAKKTDYIFWELVSDRGVFSEQATLADIIKDAVIYAVENADDSEPDLSFINCTSKIIAYKDMDAMDKPRILSAALFNKVISRIYEDAKRDAYENYCEAEWEREHIRLESHYSNFI